MTAAEVTAVLKDNRDLVINFFNENVKVDKFYNLGWFMGRVLVEANASWARCKNIGEKEITSILNKIIKIYPQIAKEYVSNYQKAVNYFGKDKADQILNSK